MLEKYVVRWAKLAQDLVERRNFAITDVQQWVLLSDSVYEQNIGG
jgi:hypothetical protein